MNRSLIVGAGAVGALVLLEHVGKAAARVGVPITAHVTAAHRAALAELDARGVLATITTATDQAWHREKAFEMSRQPMTVEAATELCTALLAACHVGVMIDDPSQYELTEGQRFQSIGVAGIDLRQAVWAALAEGADGRELTDLGRAAQQLMKRLDGLRSGFLASAHDLESVTHAAGLLAIEMDHVGYLITGKPITLGDEIGGGLDAAAAATKQFLSEKSVAAAKALAAALGELVLGSPLLLLGAGLVAWRVLR